MVDSWFGDSFFCALAFCYEMEAYEKEKEKESWISCNWRS
jgi:DNA-directed RNA polymerase